MGHIQRDCLRRRVIHGVAHAGNVAPECTATAGAAQGDDLIVGHVLSRRRVERRAKPDHQNRRLGVEAKTFQFYNRG